MKKAFNAQAGWVSRTLIILAIVILIAIAVVYFGTQLARKPAPAPEETAEPEPVYETKIGDTRILFVTATNMGDTLYASEANRGYFQDITTTEKFIKVVIAAQNKGKTAIDMFSWGMNSIVDSEGRVYTDSSNKAYGFLPQPDTCGAALKPEFAPIACTRMFEVSRASTKLGVQVWATDASDKKETVILDLLVK